MSMFNLKKLLYTPIGKMFLSIIMGLGLATLFRRVCNDRDCIRFNGPVLNEVNGRVFQYGDECYKYKRAPAKCDTSKKIIEISDGIDHNTGAPEAKGEYFNPIPVTAAAADASGAATDVSGGGGILDRVYTNLSNIYHMK